MYIDTLGVLIVHCTKYTFNSDVIVLCSRKNVKLDKVEDF